MENQSSIFLKYFNELEDTFQELLQLNNYVSFKVMLQMLCKRNTYINSKKDIIYDLSNLRNVLVHEHGNKIIAIPTDEALEEITSILNELQKPTTLLSLFNRKQITLLSPTQTVKDCLLEMKQSSFAHVPVYDGIEFKGIVTGDVILHWLVKKICNNESIDKLVASTSIGEVLKNEPIEDEAVFIAKTTTIHEFIDIQIKNPSPSNIYIITESGKRTQKPISIITPEDDELIFKNMK